MAKFLQMGSSIFFFFLITVSLCSAHKEAFSSTGLVQMECLKVSPLEFAQAAKTVVDAIQKAVAIVSKFDKKVGKSRVSNAILDCVDLLDSAAEELSWIISASQNPNGFNIHSLRANGGWIIRDHRGFPNHWGALELGHAGSPLEAETKALLAALQQAWIRGYTKIVFEGDCDLLITLINEGSNNISIANLLLDIRFWASKFRNIQFTFVKREGNQAAHNLAKFGCGLSSFYSDSVSQPLWLVKQLCNDFIQLI